MTYSDKISFGRCLGISVLLMLVRLAMLALCIWLYRSGHYVWFGFMIWQCLIVAGIMALAQAHDMYSSALADLRDEPRDNKLF